MGVRKKLPAKRMARNQPGQWTLKAARDMGYMIDTTERWLAFGGSPTPSLIRRVLEANHGRSYDAVVAAIMGVLRSRGGVRKDWGGFADYLAVKEGENPLLIQACAKSSVSARVRKICGKDPKEDVAVRNQRLRFVRASLRSGISVEVWGWSKEHRQPADCRIVKISLDDLAPGGSDAEEDQEGILQTG